MASGGKMLPAGFHPAIAWAGRGVQGGGDFQQIGRFPASSGLGGGRGAPRLVSSVLKVCN